MLNLQIPEDTRARIEMLMRHEAETRLHNEATADSQPDLIPEPH
jgi:hypothetical protein